MHEPKFKVGDIVEIDMVGKVIEPDLPFLCKVIGVTSIDTNPPQFTYGIEYRMILTISEQEIKKIKEE